MPASRRVPQPFPRPGTPAQPATGRRTAATPAPPPASPPASAPTSAGHAPAPAADDAPTEATLGVPIYPGAQFIASYDAGRGQRFYLFGTDGVVRRLWSRTTGRC